MNCLSTEERAKVIGCLIEGGSLRSTVRLTGVAKKTVSRILVEVGEACAAYHDRIIRNLPCKVLQVDEVWSFMNYNFCRIHQTLRCTPAMEAGITDHVWSLEEIADLVNIETNNPICQTNLISQ